LQKLTNGFDRLDDRHGPSPFLRDTVLIVLTLIRYFKVVFSLILISTDYCCPRVMVISIFVQTCVSGLFLVQVWHRFHDADYCMVSVGKWFIPRRTLIFFVHSVPLGQSLNTVAFVGNSFCSIRSLQLYITVL